MITFKRNPWTRDELILALDLYTRYNPSRISKHHREIIALSKILKKLPLHKKIQDRKRFRNPNSVYMKLQTFMSCDPHTKATGLTHVSKLEISIWKEFSQDLAILNKIAVAIRQLAKSAVIKSLNTVYAEESDAPAGKLLFRLHKKCEDRPKLVQKKKKRARILKCEICSFDFEKTYGPVGKGFIEMHHKVPLFQLRPTRKTRLSDLILVCSNCHHILHRMLQVSSTAKLHLLKPNR
ncbi:hypothetical protein AMJ52_03840 [candidate division TA06 bacterium DG_78]|uniref:HNH domain-containing protein n=1 Tax=candidate division TA06 bacterium DG_78 TaxID=1703772 RepID=A0A0S7YGY8_UNCT6|nr:MAG: hypothetical protein AMJ52_03840 [candidate division TA06 bacterium DG_78]